MTATPPPLLLAGLLPLGVAIAWARLALWQVRAPAADRAPWWRLALLVALQPVAAGLLFLTLQPPRVPGSAGTLVVATADAPRLDALAAGDALVALPEAPALAGAERVPDLGTALRRYPGTARLRVIGQGLPPRDREVAAGLPVEFAPAPLPPGLHALALPPAVAPGAAFRVGGNVGGVPGGSVELRDPAGALVATAVLPRSGDFVLTGAARVAGPADFSLRVRDVAKTVVETVVVPVDATVAAPPRVLVVAGAAGPDLKYLRRWASDAGIVLTASVAAGAGLDIGDAAARLDPGTLARQDLLVLDERSWAALSGQQRGAVLAAVRGGLGVVLRVTGPVPDATRRQWAALGLPLGKAVVPVRLAGAGETEATALQLGPLPRDTVTLDRDAADAPLGAWRASGRGRIGLWPVTDLYILALAGTAERHAGLWSHLFATLARARAGAPPRVIGPPGGRLALCDLSLPATVADPGGATTTLLADPAAPGCAGYWPRLAGWHSVTSSGKAWRFHIATPGRALAAAENRTAMLQLQAAPQSPPSATSNDGARGPSWPWFVGWLLVSALLWWLERRRSRRPGAGHTPADI
ncbi:carboxypeptidase regulatory-like domain-containing protein [Glacieibacterium frigidum]|uniref:Carboxypeptidase regulatory-like domain-containing protein n=1 Tax=Glacieibacterium frigidum TaxID=2593303 RepID=A0A552UEX4_9SPHN|nr:carboxypeptidase regulatory-like domain-containing protein [Glacieibacterium frigidum]TRW16719.1 carboxypeptidase regulatory-like domain-containing protein [Glacieibacterium frigidum]